MLVLSRKANQQLIIGDNIVVRIVRVSGGTVRLGIEAPAEVSIRRAEISKYWCQNENGDDCLLIGR